MSRQVTVQCLCCGKPVLRKLAELRRNNDPYCNKKCRGEMFSRRAVAAFWLKTKHSVSGCLEWTGAMGDCGYGAACFRNRRMAASRASWFINYGPLESSAQQVLHRCDNPRCVDPHHLFVGTHDDNMKDMHAKGRHRHVPQDIRDEIAVMTDAKTSEIAKLFGISERTVRNYRKGRK